MLLRNCYSKLWGAIMVMIWWLLDLQLPVQSVPITTNVVSSNPAHGEVYSIQRYVIELNLALTLIPS